MYTMFDIEALSVDQARAVLDEVTMVRALLPQTKRRAETKPNADGVYTRPADPRSAFEDPYAFLRVYLNMCTNDLIARLAKES